MEKTYHVLLLPFPAQGHINPILQFGKILVSKGFNITLATTVFLSKSIPPQDFNFKIELISDGFDETGWNGSQTHTGKHLIATFKETGSRTLAALIKKYEHLDPITCLVCDSILPWGLDVGKESGLVTVSFFTQPCAASTVVYHVTQGNLRIPVEEPTVCLPCLPELALQDLPTSLTTVQPPESTALDLLLGQFSSVENADWLFFNSFDEMEGDAMNLLGELGRVRMIGPTLLYLRLRDKRNEGEAVLNLFKPSDGNYMKWLDGKEPGSVVYISFGSNTELGEEQMKELIMGIKQSNKNFLWVVREKEQSKLPDGFAEEMADKGLLVTWCSQFDVLAHKAIGCFLTHCGWNSTMEALSLGVPMVAMPHLWDQPTTAKFIEDVWKSGIRVKKDDKGIVRGEEVESCIRKVMDSERGEIIRMNATRWGKLAKEAVEEGGSSDFNLAEFVASISYTLYIEKFNVSNC
ncbi:4-alpha-glucanotransferase [Ranunculus cassubicifolius]